MELSQSVSGKHNANNLATAVRNHFGLGVLVTPSNAKDSHGAHYVKVVTNHRQGRVISNFMHGFMLGVISERDPKKACE